MRAEWGRREVGYVDGDDGRHDQGKEIDKEAFSHS